MEIIIYLFESLFLTILISYLFYKSVYAIFLWFIIFPIFIKKKQNKKIKDQKNKLGVEFKEAMQSVSTSLTAGYSIENAFKDAQKELCSVYGNNSLMVKELQVMNARSSLNQPMEDLVLQFALRSDIEDILLFGQILYFAKRGGGDFIKIIKTTMDHISEKMEVQREIAIMIAQKELEQKIMNVIPLFILLYMDITSPKYMEVLYKNVIGIVLMTLCLIIYMLAIIISEHIIDIKI